MPRRFDLSVMDTVQASNPSSLSHCPYPDQSLWYGSYPTNGSPAPHNPSFYSYQQGQYGAGGSRGNAVPMMHFQRDMVVPNQGYFDVQESPPSRPSKASNTSKRRGRPSKVQGERFQKRKRTIARDVTCNYRNGVICDEECNSIAGSASTCCSSCSDGLPCEDPHCAIPCAETSCEKPICPEDCPISSVTQVLEMQFQQRFVPSSERISFLQETNAEPWNPVGSRTSPSTKMKAFDSCIDPDLTDTDVKSQYNPKPKSANSPTPSMAQNMATPYSADAGLQTTQFMGPTSQISYFNEVNTVIGAGGMFNSPMDSWNADNFANASLGSWTFNCPWDSCNEIIPDEQFWTQHFHQAHLDPQYTYGCPLQSNDCPETLGTNALNHLQTQHGFDPNENNFSCPAPTCSPAETYNDPAMFHNHFDQAHAIPAQGFLQCRLHSCNGSFLDQNQLLSHINESHQQLVPPLKAANKPLNKAEPAKYPASIPDSDLKVIPTCKWKLKGGGLCGETHKTEQDLQEHVKLKHLSVLSKSTGYICQWENCGRPAKMGDKQGFSQRGKLERHMASHTNFKCSECPICHQFFSAEQAMKQHKLLHTGEKPWKCKYCDKCFPQQSACTIHERTHTKDKPLKCEVCGKQFSESSNFAKHRRIHGELGKHVCEFPGCGKNFHRSDQLKKHAKTHDKKTARDSSQASSDAGSVGRETPSAESS